MLLEVKNLNIHFPTNNKNEFVHAVRDLSFNLNKGEMLGVVGESGSGKSITNLALLGLLPNDTKITADQINFQNNSLINLKESKWQKIRGKEISMIFQDPMTALNPFLTVQFQITEVLKTHLGLSNKDAIDRTVELLNLVGISSPKDRLKSYPFELSGGMAQRVMIAMSIATNPKLLIADEPTTALDVTIQKQILDLLKELQNKMDLAIILVTHDLGLVAEYSEKIQVMYAGEIIESGPTKNLISHPFHPYTLGLMESRPKGKNAEPKIILNSIPGIVPSFSKRPNGCQFNPRCNLKTLDCESKISIKEFPEHRTVRCIHVNGDKN